MNGVSDALFYVVPFLLVLTLVVTVHEMGHFLMARALDVEVERFSLGFGRSIFRWRDRAGVEWRVGWLPLGGYVKFAGDAGSQASNDSTAGFPRVGGAESLRETPASRLFHASPVWKRALVVAAGPAANFLLAIVLFGGLLVAFGATVITPRVGAVEVNSPAARAGFRAGDLVLSMDGERLDDFGDLAQYVQMRAGQPIRFVVRRVMGAGPSTMLGLVATPERRTEADAVAGPVQVGVLGLQGPKEANAFVHRAYSPTEAAAAGAERTAHIVDSTVFYLGRMVRGLESGDQLGGPLRIARVSGALAKAEARLPASLALRLESEAGALLTLAAVLSVGIGFMNLLPVPILDGGHLVFYAYEAVARRPLGARAQAIGQRVGFGLLMAMVLFATWNDLHQLSVFKFLDGLVP